MSKLLAIFPYGAMPETAFKLLEIINEQTNGAGDNSRIVEEPCAGKLASTVLNGRVTR
jgi:hypothetical protein